jgi:FkbM family methyltransferase
MLRFCPNNNPQPTDFQRGNAGKPQAHTLVFARAVGEKGLVVAFEPTDFAFAKLRRNIGLNPGLAPRIVPVQGMLRDAAGGNAAEPVYSSWPLSSEPGVHPIHLGRLMSCDGASAGALDSYVAGLGLAKADLIKIDVDGYECDVIDGAMDTLRRFRPRLVMEICPYALDERQGGSIERLCGLIARAGYSLQDIASGASLPADPRRIRDMIPPGASLNVICVPAT